MSKVVVFGQDTDVDDLGGGRSKSRHNETNGHDDVKSSDEGKSSGPLVSSTQRPVSRMVSFKEKSLGPPRQNSGPQLLLQTQASIRNFQHSLDDYSRSPTSNKEAPSALKQQQSEGIINEIGVQQTTRLQRKSSVLGPKTTFEMQAVNNELKEGMTCGGEYIHPSFLTVLLTTL